MKLSGHHFFATFPSAIAEANIESCEKYANFWFHIFTVREKVEDDYERRMDILMELGSEAFDTLLCLPIVFHVHSSHNETSHYVLILFYYIWF